MPINRIGVVGAGAMGRGIAQVCAAAGCEVRLYDQSRAAVDAALQAVADDLAQAVARGKLDATTAQTALGRLAAADDLAGLAACELVVEAVVENMTVKRQLFAALEAVVADDTILATNTSSLSVSELAAACRLPGRVAGWHFFNPVPRMRVVEVIRAPRTCAAVVEALRALSARIGHRAVVAGDSTGFVVNHAGRAFVTEGLKMLAERAGTAADLDFALTACAGFRMGPFELLDLTGLDVSVPVMESIHGAYYGDDRYRPAALARHRMAAGLLGRKSGGGFYRYPRVAPEEAPASVGGALPGGQTPPGRGWLALTGPAAVPAPLRAALQSAQAVLTDDAQQADWLLFAPVGDDLTTVVADAGADARRAVGVDALFAQPDAVTLMRCPATQADAVQQVVAAFARSGRRSVVLADSPGFAAQRVVAGVVNLACEMAQQGIATPQDIDDAVRLGLGYPQGPLAWGDAMGPAQVLRILTGLQRCFGDPRYRPSPWLVRRARLGLSLRQGDM